MRDGGFAGELRLRAATSAIGDARGRTFKLTRAAARLLRGECIFVARFNTGSRVTAEFDL